MKVSIEHDGHFIPEDIKNTTIRIVEQSLESITTINGKFVVNNTLFFRRQSSGRVTPCVMNSASYLSGNFQKNLASYAGCQGETCILEQNIDGFITARHIGEGYKIQEKNKLLEVIHRYIEANNLPEHTIYNLFPMFYRMYVHSGIYDISRLPNDVKHLFKPQSLNLDFRIGVEFETGNVASSFRAINKLAYLYQSGKIDAGVFITSIDKSSSATQIWPVSNRNGSFQELYQRKFTNQISLPLICIGFAPDYFDSKAPYLGKGMTLYNPIPTGEDDNSGSYSIFLDQDKAPIFLPKGAI